MLFNADACHISQKPKQQSMYVLVQNKLLNFGRCAIEGAHLPKLGLQLFLSNYLKKKRAIADAR
jgi:hypothetical protein